MILHHFEHPFTKPSFMGKTWTPPFWGYFEPHPNLWYNNKKLFTPIRFFYKQPSCYGFNVKNGLKVTQLAKQPPFKKLLRKILVGLTKKILFWILSSLKLIFSTTVSGPNLIVYVFWADTGNNRKIVHFTFMSDLSKWKMLSNS